MDSLPQIACVSYPVKDLAVAMRFYEQLLERAPAVNIFSSVVFELGNINLQLAIDLRPRPPAKEGVLLTWRVPDLAVALARVAAAGGALCFGPSSEDGPMRATVTDPFGNYVALTENGPPQPGG